MVGATGALLPFLRLELGLSFTQTSQHPSAYALGLLVSSLTADRLSRRLGSRQLLWGGAFGMATGTVVVMLAPNFFWSLLSFFLMGWLGALTAIEVSAVLSALHGPNRARAIPEANVLASLCTVLAPLCVSIAVTIGFGWRAGVSLAPFALSVIALCLWRTELPQADPVKASSAARLPGLYWRYWTTLVLFTAAEFGVLYWAVEYLQSTGLTTAAAAPLGLSTFFLAMLTGRATGARLAGRVAAKPLLLISLGITLGGFFAYWLGSAAWLQFTGLFFTGLGIANLYPFTVALALDSVTDLLGRASARIYTGVGLAILVAPFVLGALADLTSLMAAQVFLPLCLAAAFISLWTTSSTAEPVS